MRIHQTRRLMFITAGPAATPGVPATPADAIAALDASDGTGDADARVGTGDPAPDVDDADPEGSDELGDKGKQALDRMKERLRAEKAKRLAAEQKLAEKVGEDDAARIEREATAKANQRIVRAELKTAAKGVVNDAALPDILALIHKTDLEAIEVDDHSTAPVYKYSYVTPDYILGSSQGGLLQPIQQQTWSLVWQN